MRKLRAGMVVLLLGVCLQAWAQTLTVRGTLVRAMAIGGESTGWSIELDAGATIDGKLLNSVEIDYGDKSKLAKLENQRVRAKGKVTHRHGVETGDRPVLALSSIKALPAK